MIRWNGIHIVINRNKYKCRYKNSKAGGNLKNFKTCSSLDLDTELSKHVSKTPIHSRDPNPLNVVISYLGATAGASRAEF